MTEAEKQALAIYEMICATSGDRPLWGNSVEPADARNVRLEGEEPGAYAPSQLLA